MSKNLYEKAGVSLSKSNQNIQNIEKLASSTKNKGVISNIGNFAGLFDLSKYYFQDPILVSSSDGVGTKVHLVSTSDRGHDTIGIDLVAMCLNDLAVLGAQPLFFLDYFSTGKLNPEVSKMVIKGISTALQENDTALLGGETAEMPDVYQKNQYDLAGFAVGAVERSKMIDGPKNIKAKDCIIGLASNGLHANGFSLVRKILFKDHGFAYVEKVPWAYKTIIGELLEPTKIYVKTILGLHKNSLLKGAAHITGGGFYENIPRILPNDLTFEIDFQKVPVLPVFKWLQQLSKASDKEMFSVFNMGIGMILVVDSQKVNQTLDWLKANGEKGYLLGKVISK